MAAPLKAKVVFFDTSFLIAHQNRSLPNEAVEQYLRQPGYIKAVQDTFIDEFWANGDEDQKSKAAQFYEENGLTSQEDVNRILLKEYYDSHAIKDSKDFLPENDTLLSFLQGKGKEQEYKKYDEFFQGRKDARESQWCHIPVFDQNEVKIDTNKIYARIDYLIQGELPFSFTLADAGHHKLTIFKNKAYLSSAIKKISKKDQARGFSDLKIDLPTLYNIFIYSVFIDCLMKPNNKENPNKFFEITIDGQKLKISKNILPDFRIVLPALHYSDLFVTCDQHQYHLIYLLYPHYSKKLKLVSLDN